MHLSEIAQLGEDAKADEEEVDHPRNEQWNREVDDVVVERPGVVHAEHLAPGNQNHDDDQAEVVEAGETHDAGDYEHDRCGHENRDGPTRKGPNDRSRDEHDARDIQWIANQARPVAEEDLLPRETRRSGGQLRGGRLGHFSLPCS
jgi:hypothetical protein